MNTKDITAQIIQIYKNEKDELLRLLKIFDLTKEIKITEIIDIYNSIQSGNIDIVIIKSAVDLEKGQKKELEEKINKQFNKELIFDYQLMKNLKGGLEIKVNDTLLNLDLSWY